MTRIKLERKSPDPLQQQIYAALQRAIADGSLVAGTRLPSTRALARSLGVSRNTVLAAYELLELEGLVGGRVGSGTRVRTVSIPTPPILRPAMLLRQAQYPVRAVAFEDPEGNLLYARR